MSGALFRVTCVALVLAVVWIEPSNRQAPATRTVELTGALDERDHHALLERTFTVPSGVRQMTVTLTGGGPAVVIDLGLRGPAGLRGWSGGRREPVIVGALTASFGYLPGPIEPGEWAVIIGVPHADAGAHADYAVRIDLSDRADVVRVAPLRTQAGWFVGDLHSHSGHSDGYTVDAAVTRIGAPVAQVVAAAQKAGLDFCALTDHNTASHWLDLDRLQASAAPMLMMHAREITTYDGHVNAIGERTFGDFRLGPSVPSETLFTRLAVGDAFLSINHPTAANDRTCMGCGWRAGDRALQRVHGVEVVNGPGRSAALNGWSFWADALNAGRRLTLVGGSDTHDVSGRLDATRSIGSPATVVFARELSETAILEGLHAGRAYVRARGVSGPRLELAALANGVEHPMGADAPAGEITLRAHITGAIGQTLTWMRRGQPIGRAEISTNDDSLSLVVSAAAGDWFAVITTERDDPTLFSNAIYVR